MAAATVTRRILVVAQAPVIASRLVRALGSSADDAADLVVMTNFDRAKKQLLDGVDLLITEVKLGAYNGLHLAVRALAAGIPSIVIGPAGAGFEHEANRLGAAYLADTTLTDSTLDSLITHLVSVRDDLSECLPWGDQPSHRDVAVADAVLH